MNIEEEHFEENNISKQLKMVQLKRVQNRDRTPLVSNGPSDEKVRV